MGALNLPHLFFILPPVHTSSFPSHFRLVVPQANFARSESGSDGEHSRVECAPDSITTGIGSVRMRGDE